MDSGSMSDRILLAGAALALAAGVVVTAGSIAQFREHSSRLNVYAGQMRQLEAPRQVWARSMAAIGVFEQLPNPHPVPVAQLLKEVLTSEKYSIQEPQSRPTIEGWAVRRIEVIFNEIELKKLADFLVRAESQRPPWRLVEGSISSLSNSGGSGRVSIVLEALDKTR